MSFLLFSSKGISIGLVLYTFHSKCSSDLPLQLNFLLNIEGSFFSYKMRILKGKRTCDVVPNVRLKKRYSVFLVYFRLVLVLVTWSTIIKRFLSVRRLMLCWNEISRWSMLSIAHISHYFLKHWERIL